MSPKMGPRTDGWKSGVWATHHGSGMAPGASVGHRTSEQPGGSVTGCDSADHHARLPFLSARRSELVRAWTQPLRLALFGEESFRKVHPLFQLAHPPFQLIDFAEAGLNIVQRLALLGRVE